ncbi:MAG: 6-bladed beta-propeller [Gemmatimonadales bacterium]|nr:6-bladed beta-propeller [Gemmatimonadales bacterium]
MKIVNIPFGDLNPALALAALAVVVFPMITDPCAAAEAVTEIKNSGQPSDGLRTLELEETWRIGGPEDEENLLGVIDKVLVDADGSTYLMDIQLNEVQVFSTDGEYLRTFGKEGDGPGEVRRLSDTLFLPDGNLGLIQAFPGRIIMLDMKGLPAGEFRLGAENPAAGGMFALETAAVSGDRMVLGGRRMSRTNDGRTATHFIARYDLDGNEYEVFYEATSERNFSSGQIREADNFSPISGAWALDTAGRVIVATKRNEYRLEVFLPDGSPDLVFTRPYESWRRSAEEIARMKESALPFRRRNRAAPEFVVEPTEKDILQVRTTTDGRIWVLPSRGIREQPAGIHSTWDVFEADGRFVQQVAIQCGGRGLKDALFFAGEDIVVLVKEHADAMAAFRGRGGDDSSEGGIDDDAQPLEIIHFRVRP